MNTKPQIGQIQRGSEIGRKQYRKHIWLACVDCGKERWVVWECGKPRHQRCRRCSCQQPGRAEAISRAKRKADGRKVRSDGYILLWIPPDDFFAPMRRLGGYVMEHRLVMAKSLGRCLQLWEIVHHKNGIRDDNRLGNLELTMNKTHATDHSKGYSDGYTKGFTDGRSKKIQELEHALDAARQVIKVLYNGGDI